MPLSSLHPACKDALDTSPREPQQRPKEKHLTLYRWWHLEPACFHALKSVLTRPALILYARKLDVGQI